uniref:Uncharacterized protein n=1 Tax=Pyxicephalus adspersus TaxID=30357 RepID=A0AAV3A7X8_PYXAD|nr:TPA: hypothetical protein GDO54_018325 [Pyxicephalus adspersus]
MILISSKVKKSLYHCLKLITKTVNAAKMPNDGLLTMVHGEHPQSSHFQSPVSKKSQSTCRMQNYGLYNKEKKKLFEKVKKKHRRIIF